MTPVDYSKFRLSLWRLAEQYRNPPPGRTRFDAEGVAGSVIQRFDVCFDCLWKVLKRHLIADFGPADPPNSSKPLLRIAGENGLLHAGAEQWLRYANARVDTTHDYDGEKARACLEVVPHCVEDATRLYETMTGETWEWGELGLAAAHRATVLSLLEEQFLAVTVWAFGSRVQGTSRPHSDLDLVVFSTPEEGPRIAALREAFEESDLPFRVDLFVWEDMLPASETGSLQHIPSWS